MLRTQNLGFLPHVSPANGLAIPAKRADALIQDLRQGRDDIVLLEECFDLTVAKRLVFILFVMVMESPSFSDSCSAK